jgi:DNA ligase (NAD+)
MNRSKPVSKMTLEELEQAVRHHNYLYFVKDSPEISDSEFDQLVRKLQKLKPNSPILDEIVSESISGERPKIRHQTPMLSLNKAYSEGEVVKWATQFEGPLIASPKIDGLALEIRYGSNGQLAMAVTRGDGEQGDLITDNIRMVTDIPQKLSQGNIEVRGEVYMRRSVFKESFSDKFASPRNLAAGALKQKDAQKTKEFHLSFFAYDLLGLTFESEQEKFKELNEHKFPTVDMLCVDRDSIETVYQSILKKVPDYDFDTDGVVFKADLIKEQKALGLTAHHPKHSIAYKFQGEAGVTTLKDVEWNVARTGVITPVGIVEPVFLSGASLSRISLHNCGLMTEKNLRVGSEVLVIRSGGVIPYLQEVKKAGRGKPFKAPKKCPSCGVLTELREDFLYCSKPNQCVKAQVGSLIHFVSIFEIDGFGPKLIEKLYDAQLVNEAADFFDLNKEELLELERMGEVLADKLVRTIQGRRKVSLATFIAALGIREVGTQVARLLTEHFKTFAAIQKANEEDLLAVDTVGPVIVKELQDGLKDKKNQIDRLLQRVTIINVGAPLGAPHALQGKKICFTGSLTQMSRSEAQKKVESLGGIAVNTVTKDLDYLVMGGEGKAGSKPAKARTLIEKGSSLQIISERVFLKKLIQ